MDIEFYLKERLLYGKLMHTMVPPGHVAYPWTKYIQEVEKLLKEVQESKKLPPWIKE